MPQEYGLVKMVFASSIRFQEKTLIPDSSKVRGYNSRTSKACQRRLAKVKEVRINHRTGGNQYIEYLYRKLLMFEPILKKTILMNRF